MSAAFEITAAGFVQGAYRHKLALPKHSFRQANCLLWGGFPGKQPSVRISHAPRQVKVKAVLLKNVGHSGSTESELKHVQRVAVKVVHFYQVPLLQDNEAAELLKLIQSKVSNQIIGLKTEQCYKIGVDGDLPTDKHLVLRWLLGETYEPENLGTESFLDEEMRTNPSVVVVEVGPRLSFSTAWSSKAVSICRACGLTEISRLERSRRYLLYLAPGSGLLIESQINDLAALVHDRMTECIYNEKLTSFERGVAPEEVRYIPVMEKGRKALEEINEEMGLAFDEQDLQYYTKLFVDDIKRNLTNVELFDMAQSNSELSRHCTLQANPSNSVIGFKDNSSAIRGFPVDLLRPTQPGLTCPLDMSARDLDILFTAETHTFPCAVAPYPGAETGAGGRIRDTHATGRGSYDVASTAGLYEDFRNKVPNGERREWLKPIMFSAGIGQIDHSHISKGEPEIGMLVVKIGGPAYRIGMGGGAASSMVSGQTDAELDFNAGAGGNCNVVKEIIYPKGATIDIRAVVVGDYTMSVLEIWGAEYQEQDAILVNPGSHDILQSICKRERVSMAVLGTISGEGWITLVDGLAMEKCNSNGLPPPPPAVDLELEKVLGDMPQKTFEFHRVANAPQPLDIAPGITVMESLKRVLRLPSIASKRFLTTKVDRCATGLVAQQQTVGPLQITLSDVAVISQSYTDITGAACSIGEQPIKGLLNPGAMARLAVGEALTNLVWARITSLSDVKASGNWMYATKLDGEGAAMCCHSSFRSND
ncbi:phosphoribosylformylglycinamidine synthase [Salvia divinorum]|uniref:Phosphoribosylformylglycinamidine synthase n=1 Tax=Salvia divinorum TaxID=28513 RepID=A0ABD1H8P6_SALDI